MQPTIICLTPSAGMIYLNGRFAGEASPQRPLFAPVSPSGALYLEYVPLEGDCGGMARRLVLSGGVPLAEPLADADGLCCVAWPGGALEIELTPPRHGIERFTLEGMPCAMSRGSSATLSLSGVPVALPDGAGLPRLLRLKDAAALMGKTEGGEQYLAALAADLSAQTGLLTADVIEPGNGGLFSAFASLNDFVDHGRLEQWLVDGEGLYCVSAESAWSAGGPRRPVDAGETMIAAVEAALAGLPGESQGYLSPTLAAERPLDAVGEICDLCVPMKYGVPDARPCVGLLRASNDHLATVRPLYYRAEPSVAPQSPWQIEAVWLE